MDTKTLVIGQDVYILSGPYYHSQGKVVNVNPSTVEVKTKDGEIMRFDKNGLWLDWEPVGFRHPDGWLIAFPEWPQWEIDDIPFEDRTALMEQGRKGLKRTEPCCTAQAYIDIVSTHVITQCDLHSDDLREIGKFTRKNVLNWLERSNLEGWADIHGYKDFRAVSGNIDIEWAKKDSMYTWGCIHRHHPARSPIEH
jgi:hypothetical protein